MLAYASRVNSTSTVNISRPPPPTASNECHQQRFKGSRGARKFVHANRPRRGRRGKTAKPHAPRLAPAARCSPCRFYCCSPRAPNSILPAELDSGAAMPVTVVDITDRKRSLQVASNGRNSIAVVVHDRQIPPAEVAPARIRLPSADGRDRSANCAAAGTVTSLFAPQAVNQIVGLQLRESEQAMRMEFVLRDKVVAYLRERGENHFDYRLREIESQIDAPRIRDNRWVRALAIDAVDGGVDIDFETAPDILVETRQSLVDGEAVWVIGLRRRRRPRLNWPMPRRRRNWQRTIRMNTRCDGPPASPAPEVTAAEEQLCRRRQTEVKLEIRLPTRRKRYYPPRIRHPADQLGTLRRRRKPVA